MIFIINGMGCGYGGGRFVLENLCNYKPETVRLFVIAPLIKSEEKFSIKDAQIIHLRHSIWGKYLRPVLDITISIFSIFKNIYVFNLSNYGFTPFGKNILYIHNPAFVKPQIDDIGFGSGRINWVNRFAFKLSLKKSILTLVQSDHVKKELLFFCKSNDISPETIKVIKPLNELTHENNDLVKKRFKFQLFYPTSGFPHKNNVLAINSTQKAFSKNNNVGLVITDDSFKKESNCVDSIGKISRNQVDSFFKVSDALLFTSSKETLGLPLLEALNIEKPAILPDEDYAKEIYGDSGLYFNEYNEEEISEMILELYENYEFYLYKVRERRKYEISRRYGWKEHWIQILKYIGEDEQSNY